jgi:hypothetical protein
MQFSLNSYNLPWNCSVGANWSKLYNNCNNRKENIIIDSDLFTITNYYLLVSRFFHILYIDQLSELKLETVSKNEIGKSEFSIFSISSSSSTKVL